MAIRTDPDPNAEVLAARASYPWEEWEEGGVWTLSPGVDFNVAPAVMRTYLYTRARKRGLAVSVALLETGEVQFKFRAPWSPATRLPDAPARGRPAGVGAGAGGRVSNSARGRAQRFLAEKAAERKAAHTAKAEAEWAEWMASQNG